MTGATFHAERKIGGQAFVAELPARKAFSFPPFAELTVLTRTDAHDDKAAASAREAGGRDAA